MNKVIINLTPKCLIDNTAVIQIEIKNTYIHERSRDTTELPPSE